ncbi:hypothetical protein FRC08_014000 [Ceratobasidium sp. 394]|nr:hypothetical protein FRC08_014000 [Ceratobasidium sp. 394]
MNTVSCLLLPPLPAPPIGPYLAWPPSFESSYCFIQTAYQQAHQLLRLHNGDVARLKILKGQLETECLAMLENLENLGLQADFVNIVMGQLADCVVNLEVAIETLCDEPKSGLLFVETVQSISSGAVGKPRKVINPEILIKAFNGKRKISKTRLAKALEISRPTLNKNLSDLGIEHKFSNLTMSELNDLVHEFKVAQPGSGYRMAMAELQNKGLRVQRQRVLEALRTVDTLGIEQRSNHPITRRVYTSPYPNYLWHHDGHHKLAPWGFVIHEFIDGFDRMVVGMQASDNNRATTVLGVFLEATNEYGCPSRCCGDRGGENLAVATYMTLVRGANRGSYLWGLSTHNQRIERLWLDVGKQFGRPWKAFLLRLEGLHCLDRSNAHHLWLLHLLFIDGLNSDVTSFISRWNAHGISGPNTHGQSPQDLRFLGQLTKGVQEDIYADVPLDILQEFLGIDTEPLASEEQGETVSNVGEAAPTTTGSLEELEDDIDLTALGNHEAEVVTFLRQQLQHEQEKHVRHPPVSVPKKICPFESEEQVANFCDAWSVACQDGFKPTGYGILQGEWDGDTYPSEHYIGNSRRVNSSLFIPLSHSVWFPRAVEWAVGLHIMNTMLENHL